MGFAGLFRRETGSAGKCLLIGVQLFALTLFAIPGVVVYDGVRLFLMAFPLWAVLVGRGAAWLYDACKQRWSIRTAWKFHWSRPHH